MACYAKLLEKSCYYLLIMYIKKRNITERQDRPNFESVLSAFIAELAEQGPIIIQNSSNPSSRKNLVVRPYNRTTLQGATFNMRGQLYCGHANAMAFSSSPVVSVLGSESDDLGSSPGWGKALCP